MDFLAYDAPLETWEISSLISEYEMWKIHKRQK